MTKEQYEQVRTQALKRLAAKKAVKESASQVNDDNQIVAFDTPDQLLEWLEQPSKAE